MAITTIHIFTSNLIILVRLLAYSLARSLDGGGGSRDDDSAVVEAAAAASDVVVVVVVVHENPKITNAQKNRNSSNCCFYIYIYILTIDTQLPYTYEPSNQPASQLTHSTSENRGRVDMAGQLV